ncbi:hypothetical protein HNS38_16595 [Lentimicrobium sp. L6]|uniref:S41 family peptidase n=1 Tax=Lentimicrobium sp. L6 TaxID=2735916 RepID=UPI001557C6A9|nr:S41 family peptidase [Lentimicrobium sp. L6]NPD86393.1 hypothetical protein [Lentimicrobium sp. L6]
MKFKILLIYLLIQNVLYAQSDYNDLFSENIIQFIEDNYSGFDNLYEEDQQNYKEFKKELLADSIQEFSSLVLKTQIYLKYFNNKHLYVLNESLEARSETKFNKQKQKNKNTDVEFEILDKDFTCLKIKSFNIKLKPEIDSIISSNQKEIERHKYLIIDLRGNGGGDIKSINRLVSLIQSDYFFKKEYKMYVSSRNSVAFKAFTEHLTEQDRKKWQSVSIGLQRGEYVSGNITYPYVFNVPEKKNKYPKYIGILADKNTGSASELFLTMARQNPRVKVFGENTAGAFDYAMVHCFEILKDKFYIVMPLLESVNMDKSGIDNYGIQPDFYLYNNHKSQMKEIMRKWK